MLLKFEQNRMVQITRNSELLDKKKKQPTNQTNKQTKQVF